MSDTPGFDPYEVLGVGVDADEVVIQLAYRARIREAHPDIAGPGSVELAKRLNIARDWLLDPQLRARLSPVRMRAADGRVRAGAATPAWRGPLGRRRPFGRWRSARGRDGAATDLGPRDAELRAFLAAVEALSADERARLNYSLGDERPPESARYRDYLGPDLWARSETLRAAVEQSWRRGFDEPAPYVPRLGRLLPTGFLAANAAAQWILLEDFFRESLVGVTVRGAQAVDALATRCLGPWRGAVGQPRYGPRQADVVAFLAVAATLPLDAAERLARSWRRHLGRDGRGHPSEHIGPGVSLPVPPGCPDVLRISGYVAAVDASRIVPPAGLDERHHSGFRFGLRLTAHALAVGLVHDGRRDLLRPWRDAVQPDPSLWQPLGWRMPAG